MNIFSELISAVLLLLTFERNVLALNSTIESSLRSRSMDLMRSTDETNLKKNLRHFPSPEVKSASSDTQMSLMSTTCSAFSTAKSSSASCYVDLCGGGNYTISACSTCTGILYQSLYDTTNSFQQYGSSTYSTCGSGCTDFITFVPSYASGTCHSMWILMTCSAMSSTSCTGTYTITPHLYPTVMPTVVPSAAPSVSFSPSVSYTPTLAPTSFIIVGGSSSFFIPTSSYTVSGLRIDSLDEISVVSGQFSGGSVGGLFDIDLVCLCTSCTSNTTQRTYLMSLGNSNTQYSKIVAISFTVSGSSLVLKATTAKYTSGGSNTGVCTLVQNVYTSGTQISVATCSSCNGYGIKNLVLSGAAVTPTLMPTAPTVAPTSAVPSCTPTQIPSVVPTTRVPSKYPSICPSIVPSTSPTKVPSITPTAGPTAPSVMPTSAVPSLSPSSLPSCPPTLMPTVSFAPTSASASGSNSDSTTIVVAIAIPVVAVLFIGLGLSYYFCSRKSSVKVHDVSQVIQPNVNTSSRDVKIQPVKTHVFLTHDWGRDLAGRGNHDRVKKINAGLQNLGVITWFDEEKMKGNVRGKMNEGINNTQAFVVFVTKRYIGKVDTEDLNDNCHFEFQIGMRRMPKYAIPVIMEKEMLDVNNWGSGYFSSLIASKESIMIDFTAGLGVTPEAGAPSSAEAKVPPEDDQGLIDDVCNKIYTQLIKLGIKIGNGEDAPAGGTADKGSPFVDKNVKVEVPFIAVDGDVVGGVVDQPITSEKTEKEVSPSDKMTASADPKGGSAEKTA